MRGSQFFAVDVDAVAAEAEEKLEVVAAAAVAGNAPTERAAKNGTDADTNAFELDAAEAELENDDDACTDKEGIDADTETLDDAADAGSADCTATRDRMTEPGLSSSHAFSSFAAAAEAFA